MQILEFEAIRVRPGLAYEHNPIDEGRWANRAEIFWFSPGYKGEPHKPHRACVLVYLLVIAFVAIPILIAGWAMSYMFKTGGEVFEGQDAAAVRAEFDALLASPAQMSFWHALGFTGRFAEAGFFELLDYITANLMMPMGGLLLALFVGWRIAPRAVADEVNMQSPRLFRVWFWLLRWVVPVSISLIFISNL